MGKPSARAVVAKRLSCIHFGLCNHYLLIDSLIQNPLLIFTIFFLVPSEVFKAILPPPFQLSLGVRSLLSLLVAVRNLVVLHVNV